MMGHNRVRRPSNEILIMKRQSILDSECAYLPSLCGVVHMQYEVSVAAGKQEQSLAVALHKCCTISLALHQCGSMSRTLRMYWGKLDHNTSHNFQLQCWLICMLDITRRAPQSLLSPCTQQTSL